MTGIDGDGSRKEVATSTLPCVEVEIEGKLLAEGTDTSGEVHIDSREERTTTQLVSAAALGVSTAAMVDVYNNLTACSGDKTVKKTDQTAVDGGALMEIENSGETQMEEWPPPKSPNMYPNSAELGVKGYSSTGDDGNAMNGGEKALMKTSAVPWARDGARRMAGVDGGVTEGSKELHGRAWKGAWMRGGRSRLAPRTLPWMLVVVGEAAVRRGSATSSEWRGGRVGSKSQRSMAVSGRGALWALLDREELREDCARGGWKEPWPELGGGVFATTMVGGPLKPLSASQSMVGSGGRTRLAEWEIEARAANTRREGRRWQLRGTEMVAHPDPPWMLVGKEPPAEEGTCDGGQGSRSELNGGVFAPAVVDGAPKSEERRGGIAGKLNERVGSPGTCHTMVVDAFVEVIGAVSSEGIQNIAVAMSVTKKMKSMWVLPYWILLGSKKGFTLLDQAQLGYRRSKGPARKENDISCILMSN